MAKGQIRRVKSVGLTDIPEQTNGKDGVKLQDKYEMFSIPDNSNGEFIQIRQIGGFVATKTHWVALEGKEGKTFAVPKTCLAFDPETMSVSDAPCPYCEAEQWFRDHEIKVKSGKGEGNPARSSLEYVTNAIIRDLQEDITPKITLEEERETGIIQKGSKSKTPVRVVRLTPGVISKIKDVEKLNVHKVKLKGESVASRRTMPVGHDKYGIDLNIKFNPKAKAAGDYYAVQRGDASPLEAEEKELLRWDIEAWPFENEAESVEEAKKELGRMKGKHWDRFRKHAGVEDESDEYEDDEDDEDEDDEDEDERPSKKSKSKASAKSKKKSRYEDDEDEDDLDLDDEDEEDEDDEDEDERPAKKKASASKSSGKKSSKKSRDEDDDEDDDLDDDEDEDEDEDDEPRKKSKKPAPKSKKKVVDEDEDDDLDDEDEDEDDDLDDDEDEDDEPPKKSKKPAPKSKKKVVDEDEDDDLDDEDDEDEDDDLDDDEDEDDEPPRKKSSKKPAPKSKGKSKSRDEDEDEDDDLDDEDDDLDDEDEEDEPPRKKSKSKRR